MVMIPIAASEPAPRQAPLASDDDIVCPLTGEVIAPDDIDGLIAMLDRVKSIGDRLYAVQMRLRNLLASKTEGDAVTRRIRGKKRLAKVTMPDVSFEQSILKELWNSHPQLAQEYMKIGTIDVRMREYKKLVDTASEEANFTFFRNALTRACRGRIGTPRVDVEA
jgi:hypothetical protein